MGFNFEGITNGQAVGPSPTGVYVHVCPVKGMEKPCYSTASARTIYDSTPHSTIDTSYVDVKARSEIDEPSEFDLAAMMAARTSACQGTAATTSMSLHATTMDEYLLSTAQLMPSSCSESRGGSEARIAPLPLHARGRSPLAWGQWWGAPPMREGCPRASYSPVSYPPPLPEGPEGVGSGGCDG